MDGILDREQHVLAAAHHLLKALEANNSFTHDVRKLLADLDIHLSGKLERSESEAKALGEIEARLFSARSTIMNLHSHHPKIWDADLAVVFSYLQAVDEVQRSIECLENMSLKRGSPSKDLFDQAQSVMQRAMARLQEELIYILVQNKQCFGMEYVSLPALMEEESIVSNDESVENASQRESSGSEAEEYAMDLIHPDVVPQIKSIANRMFSSGYGQEFCQTFNAFWRDTLAEYLAVLDVEQFSIQDVLRMEWNYVNSRIRNWRLAIRQVIVIYLARVKHLFDQIVGNCDRASSACLLEASKACLICLLNFGQAVAMGPHQPEWLFCLLDMYEALAALIPDLNALFPEEIGSLFRIEFHELLIKLGDSAVVIFKEFGNHIAASSSTTPFMNGGIHPLTQYAINYILHIADYVHTLKSLLEDQGRVWNTDGKERGDAERNGFCPVGIHLQSLTAELEANLYKKSELYKDSSSLKDIFMVNNIRYMVQKIRKSKISAYFGDDWIKCHIAKLRQHAFWYLRHTWNPIVALLGVDEDHAGKAALKARCQDFAVAFEDVYKIHTRWSVPDPELREDLRISTSNWLIPKYRLFVRAVTNSIGEKHIKYSDQDLENYILDLLDGSPKSLNHPKKR